MQLKAKRTQTQAQLEDLVKQNPKKSKSEVLGRELCSVFMEANIPWNKLKHPRVRSFLEENLAISLPDESTVRKNYLIDCYKQIMANIKADLEGCPVWISVDETADAAGNSVGNVLLENWITMVTLLLIWLTVCSWRKPILLMFPS